MSSWFLLPRVPCQRCVDCKDNALCFFEKVRHEGFCVYRRTKLGVELINSTYVKHHAPELYNFVADQTVSRTRQRPEFSPYSYDFVLEFMTSYAKTHEEECRAKLARRAYLLSLLRPV